jgi:hypothetical protein
MPLPLSRAMSERQRARWEALRAKGPFWFVLRYGILSAGLTFATLVMLGDYFGLPGLHWKGVKPEAFRFIFNAVFFGIVLGWWAWRVRENRFRSRMIGGSAPPEWK